MRGTGGGAREEEASGARESTVGQLLILSWAGVPTGL